MSNPSGQIDSLLQDGARRLSRAGVESPRAEARRLMAFSLGIEERTILAGNLPDLDSPSLNKSLEQFDRCIRERESGKPFAYIVGKKSFYHHDFLVSPSVLIPRPETEELVEMALEDPSLKPGSVVLDLGTGSGCIGISVACERPDLEVHLSDLSEEALTVARENGKRLCPDRNIHYHSGDGFAPFRSLHFDAILSNPPYIHPKDRSWMDPGVTLFEPGLALFHPDPPSLYRGWIDDAASHLKQDGFILLESSPDWLEDLLPRAKERFFNAEIRKDLSGKERFLYAKMEKSL